MKIKNGFKVMNLSGQNTVVPTGEDARNFTNTIVLNDTALYLWKLLEEKDTSKTEMLDALLNNFDISTVLALGDIDVFIRTMRENGIIE